MNVMTRDQSLVLDRLLRFAGSSDVLERALRMTHAGDLHDLLEAIRTLKAGQPDGDGGVSVRSPGPLASPEGAPSVPTPSQPDALRAWIVGMIASCELRAERSHEAGVRDVLIELANAMRRVLDAGEGG